MENKVASSQLVGLTAQEVETRLQANQSNQMPATEMKTNLQIISTNTFTFFNLIFLVLSLLLIWVKSYRDLTFLPVIVLNTVIAIIQEIRSKHVLEKISMMHVETCNVSRDGAEKQVPTENLVLGDLVHLKTGDQIPADAQLVQGHLQVNEALLTGEADEVAKKLNDDLLSGSFVVSGDAYVVLRKVGADSYISQLYVKAKRVKADEESAMIKSLNRLIKIIGMILVPLGLLLFSQSYFLNGNTLRASVVSMEAALIGMIPEGLYLLATVALALSAMRLAKKQVLLHSMKSIETLAHVNVLCVDKTGTITENNMTVSKMLVAKDAQEDAGMCRQILSNLAQNMARDNDTMAALQDYFGNSVTQKPIKTIPFSSAWKFSAAVFKSGVYVIGAPEMVLRGDFKQYEGEFGHYVREGYRVLVCGKYQANTLESPKLVESVSPLAFILIRNPVRKTAPKTFKYFEQQGVGIKVFSGDNPATVASVAQEANIAGAHNYVDASTLTPDEEEAALRENAVFGRVTPEQKQRFVSKLQQMGDTVAMTGDGVNDILAMKEADCSIAMATGNDATIHAAQMVLLDSDFSRLPQIVQAGRQVVNNIERSASLFLVKNIFSLAMALLALLFAVNYPLTPSNITLISLFTIGIPSFLLALEPNVQRIKGEFLSNVLRRALPGGMTDTVVVAVITFSGALFGLYKADITSAVILVMLAVGFRVLHVISRPVNRYRFLILCGCLVGVVVTIVFWGKLFGITTISWTALCFATILALMCDSILQHSAKVINWAFAKWQL
ncbi:cation-transporting ATPase [Lactiplantibacillus plantarum EGD-AQ4]|nr:cation-transporting ATPase [Lactiplantibacillus plantarum EGD-AQ4]